MDPNLKHGEITDRILNAFFKKVYHRLGYGFLEKVYENALALELKREGLVVQQQMRVPVFYDGIAVGEYFADLVVDDKVIVELKAQERLTDVDEAQILNYLRATPYEVSLLLNFGPRPEFRRRVYDNSRKPMQTWVSELSVVADASK